MGKKINIALVFAVAVLGIFLFLLAQYGFQILLGDLPLQKELKKMSEIQQIEIKRELSGKNTLALTLGKVEDLEQTYQKIVESAEKQGFAMENMKLIDQRNDFLTDVYREMNFSLQEALSRGTFRQMQDEVRAIAEQYQLKQCVLSMDENHLYLTLGDGKQRLYQVLNRGGMQDEKRD